MPTLRPALLGLICLTVLPWPAAAQERALPLREALRQADAVVLATVDDPATDQTLLPVPGTEPFVRLQRRLHVHEVLLSRGPAPSRKDLRVGVMLRVDDAAWRQDLEAHRRCQGHTPCAMPTKVAYASELSREPRPGQATLVLLRWTADGWQLAQERAMDLPSKAAAARALLRRPR